MLPNPLLSEVSRSGFAILPDVLSPAETDTLLRVLHVEYAALPHPPGLEWHQA